ncbi:MAG: cytochrome c3 family protein [Thermodesulfobacteriota bacterium]
MIKRSDSIILLIAGILFFGVHGLWAQPDNITLNHADIFVKRQRPPVAFPHARHIEGEVSCKDCHHQYKEGENRLDESTLQEGNPEIKCSACHTPRSRIHLQRAFHFQCLSCHKNNEREGRKTGPRFCGECHLWR